MPPGKWVGVDELQSCAHMCLPVERVGGLGMTTLLMCCGTLSVVMMPSLHALAFFSVL